MVKFTKRIPGYTGSLKITQYLYSKRRDEKNSDLSVQSWGSHCSPFMHTGPLCAISTAATEEKVQGHQLTVSCVHSRWGALLVHRRVQWKQDIHVRRLPPSPATVHTPCIPLTSLAPLLFFLCPPGRVLPFPTCFPDFQDWIERLRLQW